MRAFVSAVGRRPLLDVPEPEPGSGLRHHPAGEVTEGFEVPLLQLEL